MQINRVNGTRRPDGWWDKTVLAATEYLDDSPSNMYLKCSDEIA